MSNKYITIKFSTTDRKYETDMEQAKVALNKAMKASISEGKLSIDSVKITIETDAHSPIF